MQLTTAERGAAKAADKSADGANSATMGGAILLAALALPGLAGVAHADTAPDQGTIELKDLNYRDWQPGLDRITVHSPSVDVMAPIAGVWSLEGSVVSDSISGATPRYHTAVSGATTMADHRVAEDLSLTRYFSQGSLNVGVAHSGEDDYQSRALSIGGSVSTEDKNTTANFGIAVNNDVVNPVDFTVHDAKKHTLELMAGVTQVLTQDDVVQLNVSHVAEQGYLSDPYKDVDTRPDERTENILLLRWNHHLDSTGGTSRFSYRYYADTYEIKAHTFNLEYVQPMSGGWTLTPSARIYTQSAAGFYVNPVYDPALGAPFPPGYVFGSSAYISEDQRLSAFGAYTIGLKLEKQLTRDLQVNMKIENYEQRGSWALFGSGSPGLEPFYARIIQVGLLQHW
jgi:hypothetical protein